MSPAKIILKKISFDEKELAEQEKKASEIFADYPFLAAAYIYKNTTKKELNEKKDRGNDKAGLDIFSIIANLEIEKASGDEVFAEKYGDEIFFLRELINTSWDFEEAIAETEKKGKKLNKPFRTPSGPKKFGVYVKNDKGNVVLVRFGDPNLSIKRDDPERRKSFRARHGCDNPGPKWKAKYWSCKFWSSKPVSELTAEEFSEIDWDDLPTQEEIDNQ